MIDNGERLRWWLVVSVFGAVTLSIPGPVAAQGHAEPMPTEEAPSDAGSSEETKTEEKGATGPDPGSGLGEGSVPEPGSGERPPGGMVPREALVDMARAQSNVICASERFLGCMGFDGRECLTLSEAAIDQCLMPLPPEIDPIELDTERLEACPRALYERAGYAEEDALVCLERALEAP